MDRSLRYGQVMSNFDSAYNVSSHQFTQPIKYISTSPSSSFCSHRPRSISPSLTSSSNPTFNLDLYHPHEYHSESMDYPSPSSSVVIHHHPVHSPPSPRRAPSQAISKLRQINDELCYTLAHCDLINQPQPPAPSYPIHHHPVPQQTYHHSRSSSRRRSPSSSSSAESEPVRRKPKSRIRYKVHVPRKQNSLSDLDHLLIRTSDAYSHDDPMTVDYYPSRDQGFVKTIRNRPDNQSPWLADRSPIRRNSYSESGTYRTPRTPTGPDYDGRTIQPNSRLASCKERPRSSPRKARFHRSTDVFASTGPDWRPNGSIKRPRFIGSNAPPIKPKILREPVWNPSGGKRKTKTMHAFEPAPEPPPKPREPVWKPAAHDRKTKTIRAFEPAPEPPPKPREPVWKPATRERETKTIRAFEPAPEPPPKPREPIWKPSLTKKQEVPVEAFDPTPNPAPQRIQEPLWIPPSKSGRGHHAKVPIPARNDSSAMLQTGPSTNVSTIRRGDPKLRTRLAKTESKVKSAWEGQPTGSTLQRRPSKTAPTIHQGNPKLRTRIAQTESKVKSAWKPPSDETSSKPPLTRPEKKTTTTLPPRTEAKPVPSRPIVPVKKTVLEDIDTGRSSLQDIPKKPIFQSTPKNISLADGSEEDPFGDDSEVTDILLKQKKSPLPPRLPKTPPKLPPTSVPEPDKKTKTTIKNGVLIHGSDEEDVRDQNLTPPPKPIKTNPKANDDEELKSMTERTVQPSPIPPPRKVISPKPTNRDDESVIADDISVGPDGNDTDQDIEQSFEQLRSRDGTASATGNASKKIDTASPAVSARKTDQPLPKTTTTAAANDDVNDFFS